MKLRAVLLDATGTLIEVREPVGVCYARIATPFGVTLPAWRIEDAFQRILGQAPPMLFPEVPTEQLAECERGWWQEIVRRTFLAADSTVRFSDFESFFNQLYRHYCGARGWALCRGAQPALAALRQSGLAIGIVSNFDQRLPKILELLEILDKIDSVTIPATCRARKPDRRIFEAALRSLGVAASEAIYVGDDPEIDVEAARAAGLRAVDVRQLPALEALPGHLERLARDPATRHHRSKRGSASHE